MLNLQKFIHEIYHYKFQNSQIYSILMHPNGSFLHFPTCSLINRIFINDIMKSHTPKICDILIKITPSKIK